MGGERLADSGGDGIDHRDGFLGRKIVEQQATLAIAVAASTPRDHQCHGAGRKLAIAVGNPALDERRAAGLLAQLEAGSKALLVGAPQEQGHEDRAIEQPARPQPGDQRVMALGSDRTEPVGEPRDEFVGNGRDEIVEHRRHQRPLLLGQARSGIEVEVATDGIQPNPPRAARRVDRAVCCSGSDRPFLRHHHRRPLAD
jgi:hypothetical protein